MGKKIQLHIPEPCHEDWDNMNPADKGRFCLSCQKTVVDFSGLNDEQVFAFFRKPTTGSVCGRFRDDQLARDFAKPRKRIPWLKYFFQFTIPAFLVSMKATAQGKVMVKETNKTEICDNTLKGDTVLIQDIIVGELAAVPQNTKNISGTVTDEEGNGIPYASVLEKGTNHGVACDSVGNFSIEITEVSKKSTLIFSSVGYELKEMNAESVENDTFIELKTTDGLTGVTIKTSAYSRRLGGMISVVTITKAESVFKKIIKNDSVRTYPNPAPSGSPVTLEVLDGGEGQVLIDVFSAGGQPVYKTVMNLQMKNWRTQLNLPALTPGVYFIQLHFKESGKKESRKIIIN